MIRLRTPQKERVPCRVPLTPEFLSSSSRIWLAGHGPSGPGGRGGCHPATLVVCLGMATTTWRLDNPVLIGERRRRGAGITVSYVLAGAGTWNAGIRSFQFGSSGASSACLCQGPRSGWAWPPSPIRSAPFKEPSAACEYLLVAHAVLCRGRLRGFAA